jgi:non-canonical poly(A) RNA polymerase PAPD5/7
MEIAPTPCRTLTNHSQKGKNTPLPSWMLNLRDPADETNDLGRRIVAWKHIKATFKSLSKMLRRDMETNSHHGLLGRFARSIYPLQLAHRERLRQYGRELSRAGREYTPSEISLEAAEIADAMTEDADAITEEQQFPDRTGLDAIAKSIRKVGRPQVRVVKTGWIPTANAEAVSKAYEGANKQSVADADKSEQHAETLERAKEAAQIDDVQGVSTWLKDIEEASEHKQTGESFANILGLNKKANK